MTNSNRKNYSKISTEGAKAKQAEETKVESTLEPAEPEVEEKVEIKPEVKKGVVVCKNRLNIRKGPSLSAEIVDSLLNGKEVTICGEEGEFYKIGESEYCMKKYISIKK